MAQVMTRRTKFVLDEDRIPRAWYNIAADLPVAPSPYLHPATLEPIAFTISTRITTAIRTRRVTEGSGRTWAGFSSATPITTTRR